MLTCCDVRRIEVDHGAASLPRLLAGLVLISILLLVLTGIADDVFWAYVDFTLRHGG